MVEIALMREHELHMEQAETDLTDCKWEAQVALERYNTESVTPNGRIFRFSITR